MKTQRFGKFALRTIPFLITAACATNAFAQDGMDEVVVSAQKRTQRIQDVPMAISAISGQALEDRKIEGAADLQGAVPNLTVVAAPGSSLIAASSMRGLSSAQPSIWMDPAVGMYVDGVFVGKNQGALFDMLDLERVEVLRGPQGTLFGRNTLGGAINFVTRKPSGQFSGNVGLELGNYGRVVEKISIDTPKTDNGFSMTLAGRKEKQDGWLNNPNASEKWGNRNREAFKLNAAFDVSKDTKLTYGMDRSDINETTTPISLTETAGSVGFIPGISTLPNFVQKGVPTSTGSSVVPLQKLKVTGHVWGVETALNATTKIKYTGSHRSMDYADRGDYDGSSLDVFGATKDTKYKTDTHELQVTGSAKDINYVAGLYYFKDDGTTLQDQFGRYLNVATNGGTTSSTVQSNFAVGTVAKAAYGQVDYSLNKDTTLTGGLRYTTEEKTGSVWRVASGFTYASFYDKKASFSAVTPTLALSYKLSPSQMVFGRVAQGFKSGGFPLEAGGIAAAGTAFKPEKSTSYEVGIKGADGGTSYAATAFIAKLRDQQISSLPPGTISPTINNAGSSTYKGLELELAHKITKDTKFQAGLGYLDAQFDTFRTTGSNSGGAQVDAASNLVVGYAPKYTINLNLDSRLANTDWGRLKGLIEYRYSSAYYIYAANISRTVPNAIGGYLASETKMPALGTVNARLTLDQMNVGGPGQMDVSLWVKNLTNKQTVQNLIDLTLYKVGYWSNPRTVGVTANYKW